MADEPKKEKMTLPVVHDACPVCGSKKRLAQSYIQQLKDEGVLPQDAFKDGLAFQTAMLDPLHPPSILSPNFKIKVVLIFWDVCECGMMYSTKFEAREAPAQMQMQAKQPPSQQGFPPFMGKGFKQP